MITLMAMGHVNAVISVHLRSFEGFFLSSLGLHFLRLYYESIVEYKDSMGYVYLEGGRVVGFVSGARRPSGFYSYLIRTRWWRFALAALRAVLQRPSIIPRLFRAFLYPSQTSRREDGATLMSIAVEPSAQGQGTGGKLTQAFLQAMRAQGVRYVDVLTDRYGNDTVNLFYEGQGFRYQCTVITPEGRAMKKYLIEL